MLVGAVVGRGPFYYATMAAIVAVLALSANTSFADFPRLCRVLAEDRYLPGTFAVRGRRLVFSQGIVAARAPRRRCCSSRSAAITDRLIPLFAIGAFLAFTLSQAGMVQHWRRDPRPGRAALDPSTPPARCATGVTLVVVAVSKFAEGAWLTVVVVPLLVPLRSGASTATIAAIAQQIATIEPLELPERATRRSPCIAAGSWNKMTQHGLTLRAAPGRTTIYVVQMQDRARPDRGPLRQLGAAHRKPARARRHRASRSS